MLNLEQLNFTAAFRKAKKKKAQTLLLLCKQYIQ